MYKKLLVQCLKYNRGSTNRIGYCVYYFQQYQQFCYFLKSKSHFECLLIMLLSVFVFITVSMTFPVSPHLQNTNIKLSYPLDIPHIVGSPSAYLFLPYIYIIYSNQSFFCFLFIYQNSFLKREMTKQKNLKIKSI